MTPGEQTDKYLAHFSGPDRPGVTAAITAALAVGQCRILDIGQAVVHEHLALGILLEAADAAETAALRSSLDERARELGLTMRLTPGTAEALTHWRRGLEDQHLENEHLEDHRLKDQHLIVTVLGRRLDAIHLARISAALTARGMNIDRIERLSGGLLPDTAPENACIELGVSGDPAEEAGLRVEFLKIAQELAIDIAVQRESPFRRNRRLFAFDMDSTLIQGEVIDELAKLKGVGERVAKITESAMRGEIDFDESFARRVALLKGLPAEKVYALLGTIPLTDGAARLIGTLKALGYKTAILSGGFMFFARSLKERLGIDFIHSNELEIVDGAVTGRVIPPIINGARKAALLKEIAEREGIALEQVVAVGDGANDIPMLNAAGMGIAYRAKPLVREKADQSISCLGLDGLLYLIGVRDRDVQGHEGAAHSPMG
ncbi:MAG: phosphoserine phosphatase SerB [Terracidiphilus sp.]